MVTVATPLQYEVDQESLRYNPPECFKCHERKWVYCVLTYPSRFAGEPICGDCQKKYFDPVLNETARPD